MSKMKKSLLIIAAALVLISLAIGAKLLLDFQQYKDEMATLKVENVDLAKVANGSYLGSYDAGLIMVKVKVDVQDHKISNIELIQHENGKGTAAETIIPKVIEAQSLYIDTVSGATNSSKVILKSIEIALENGKI